MNKYPIVLQILLFSTISFSDKTNELSTCILLRSNFSLFYSEYFGDDSYYYGSILNSGLSYDLTFYSYQNISFVFTISEILGQPGIPLSIQIPWNGISFRTIIGPSIQFKWMGSKFLLGPVYHNEITHIFIERAGNLPDENKWVSSNSFGLQLKLKRNSNQNKFKYGIFIYIADKIEKNQINTIEITTDYDIKESGVITSTFHFIDTYFGMQFPIF